ncbi:MAG: hypothetical protein WC222_07330 [Parachlamydiales bacterium]|jgi:hypothetical protein
MTESRLYRFFFDHWQRKVVALFSAVILWLFVNHSITDTKTLPNIPIKIINLPADKTVVGLLPNGTLSKRITLTLSGTKDVIQDIEPSDVEVVLDASSVDTNEWIVDITKKNLVSLNPDINLASHITQVEHPDFVIHFSRLITARVPIHILPPIGEAPYGYEYMDIWPTRLFQTITGSEEEIAEIQAKKIQLEIDLSLISKADLEGLKNNVVSGVEINEVSFYIPPKLRKIFIPYREGLEEDINDPEAKNLHITFLIKQWLPIAGPLPIRVFYPLNLAETLNPDSHPLALNEKIAKIKGINVIKQSFYLYGVNKLFLDVVKDSLEIAIIAAPREEREVLEWGLNIVDAHELENTFVALLLANDQPVKNLGGGGLRRRELLLRQRFRNFMHNLALYLRPEHKLVLDAVVEKDSIIVK